MIAFDARMALHSGIGTQIQGLLSALQEMPNRPPMLLLGDLNKLTRLNFHHGFDLQRYVAPIYSPWAQLRFPKRLKQAQALHVPHYNAPYRYADPLVVTIHDLIHLLFPEHVASAIKSAYARYTFRFVARRADRIFCISEYTRRDVMERLGVEEERTALLPNAVDRRFLPTDDPGKIVDFKRRLGLPVEYLLAVGIDKPHKNWPFLFESLKPLWAAKRLDIPLAVAGAGGANSHLAQLAGRMGVGHWTLFLDQIERNEMSLLFQGATALVFPSIYEGFGLPVLEAQRVGTPVAATNAACIPEVGGEGAVYFDPGDAEACRDATLRVVSDTALRERLVAAGRRNESRYSWEDSARRLIEVYRSL